MIEPIQIGLCFFCQLPLYDRAPVAFSIGGIAHVACELHPVNR